MEVPVATIVAIVVPTAGAFISWGMLRQRLISHEQRDDDRFDFVKQLLSEVRADVKKLLGEP